MIRARMDDRTRSTKPVFFLGVTKANLERLTAGNPILVELSELGGTGTIIIAYGEDETALVAEIESHGIGVPKEMKERAERVAEAVRRGEPDPDVEHG